MLQRVALLGFMLAAAACTDKVFIEDMSPADASTLPPGKDAAAWPPMGDAACGTIYPTLNNYRARAAEVVLLFDRSGAMQTPFGSTTRADAAESALLNSILEYQTKISFGFAQFPADSTDKSYSDCQRGYCCAGTVEVVPVINAYKSISKSIQCTDMRFPCPLPSYDSPSNAGLVQVKEYYKNKESPRDDDRYVLLVTASEPSCYPSDGTDACTNALEATSLLGKLGIRVVVLSVGYQPEAGSCLLAIDDTGSPLTPPDNADTLYRPTSSKELENDVDGLFSALAKTGCTIEFSELPPSGAKLWVSVGGVWVDMDDQNGWSYPYPDHTRIKLSGWACDSYVRSQSSKPINIGYSCSTCGGPDGCQ